MKLDLSSLEKAVTSLKKTLNVAENKSLTAAFDEDTKDAIKAGVIQKFEFTYELCWKFITRWLKENAISEDAQHPRSRKELFRIAARSGLIKDPQLWFSYGDARNLTSHTYDEDKADEVYDTATDFIEDAEFLLNKLKERND